MKQYAQQSENVNAYSYLFEAEKRQERKQSKSLRDMKRGKRYQWNVAD